MQDTLAKAAAVRLVIFDVDGVLTDGSLFFSDRGEEFKIFNARDGHGLKMLQRSGVEVAILSGRRSAAVQTRMQALGIRHVHQGLEDKGPAFEALITELGIGADQVAYAGDDVIDLPVMCRVGLAIAVSDAHPLVRQHAHWQTTLPGGRGAAREVCELIMEAQGTLQPAMAGYISR
ncbi:MAG: 3-deoxy-manno-octulosonate-8-phosphatase KdsC [Proteobacteria bacterium]|nr:MAG: 3-deoxy-manno-octulosonate-8-phosphatase KdsC [Pseudomonadota bacterium]